MTATETIDMTTLTAADRAALTDRIMSTVPRPVIAFRLDGTAEALDYPASGDRSRLAFLTAALGCQYIERVHVTGPGGGQLNAVVDENGLFVDLATINPFSAALRGGRGPILGNMVVLSEDAHDFAPLGRADVAHVLDAVADCGGTLKLPIISA